MSNQKVLCTYEKIILFKKIPYWIYWPLIGMFGYILSTIILLLLHEKLFLFTQTIFIAGIGILPVMYNYFFHRFEKIMDDLSGVLWNTKAEYEEWIYDRKTRIFTLKSWGAKFITVAIVIGALLTIAWLGLPLSSPIGNALAILGFIPLLIICGQGAYLLLDMLITLREIVYRPANVPFYLQPHPAIRQLQNYFSSVAFIVTLAYICLVLGIWQGPYGFSLEMQIWLTVLAFYPISMFFWTFFHVHILLQNIKNSHIEIINKEVQRTLESVLKNHKTDDVERLEKIMNVQNKAQVMKEWPIEFQGALTFLATLATVLVQVVISIREFLKP